MAQIQKLDVQTAIQSSADKFYGKFKNNMTELSKVYPEIYKNIVVLEGDGKSVGSVILWKYVCGSNSNSVTKEKIVAVDDKNRSITFEVMEGDPMLNSFKSFALRIHVTGNGERSFVKWSLEFEKANEDVPHPNMYLDLLAKVTKKLDAYLLKA
ncbi:hypothetical protein IFM89_011609 [Coptis chinensis]|uniref:Bet v I/Major latex protein domain-containing protein n=1 Tax=Coptis chinensis TaxID=261450 RepID=A0A835H3N6_9MAGN|nr:hypothetical protein IFM89_011609 [Coptis chinensis]